jgi:sugar diacid utilization regulator
LNKLPVFPDETDLLSLFECEPKLYDTSSKDLPFYYNQATYQFSNGEEDFLIVLSPSYGEVKIQVTRRQSNRLVSLLDLKQVQKLKITADQKEHSSILLTMVYEDSEQTIEVGFKPFFKQVFKEHLTR